MEADGSNVIARLVTLKEWFREKCSQVPIKDRHLEILGTVTGVFGCACLAIGLKIGLIGWIAFLVSGFFCTVFYSRNSNNFFMTQQMIYGVINVFGLFKNIWDFWL